MISSVRRAACALAGASLGFGALPGWPSAQQPGPPTLVALVLGSASVAGSAPDASEATILVRQLGQFQAEIDPCIQRPAEQRRAAIYVKLRTLGGKAIPALQQGLTDPETQVRRNVALYLAFEGFNDPKHADAALDVTPFLPQLVRSLRDEDERVIALAAQALARDALPALHRALQDPSNDVRRFAQRPIEKIERAKP
jgi:HEAT repeat protein